MQRYVKSVVAGLVGLAVLVGGAVVVMEASAPDYQRIMKEKSPAFVTIKFILKIKAGGKESENQAETTGVMIDPKGLVLCSNTQMGGIGAYYRSMGRDVSATPAELKVLIGEDTEGLDAKILTRDTELDLAWVQIKEPGDKEFAYIDLSDSVEGKVGQPVIGIHRMAKFFDRAAVITESRIAGVTKKPRRLYAPIAVLPLTEEFGLPVFTPEGKVLGVPILQGFNEGDQEQVASDRMSRGATMQQLVSGLVLPAADVVEATRQAKLAAATRPAAEDGEPAASEPASSQPKAKLQDKSSDSQDKD